MDEKRIRHGKVTFNVVAVMITLMFAIAMDGAGKDVTWHVYACLALTCATVCFVIWRA